MVIVKYTDGAKSVLHESLATAVGALRGEFGTDIALEGQLGGKCSTGCVRVWESGEAAVNDDGRRAVACIYTLCED